MVFNMQEKFVDAPERLLFPLAPYWVDTFSSILEQKVMPNECSLAMQWELKASVIKSCHTLMLSFPITIKPNLPRLVVGIWDNIMDIQELYPLPFEYQWCS
jgi:hypothetical protein